MQTRTTSSFWLALSLSAVLACTGGPGDVPEVVDEAGEDEAGGSPGDQGHDDNENDESGSDPEPIRNDAGAIDSPPVDASIPPRDTTPGTPNPQTPRDPMGRTRLVVTTDIENEPDDQQSLVRLLTYANEFEMEGLVATTSTWLRTRVAPARIKEVVNAYGKVRGQLLKHASGYPTEADLLARVKAHLPLFGMSGVGDGKDSEGSRFIMDVVDRNDPRPVWIAVWGGANALAQVLHKVRATRTREQLTAFVRKLRVYAISDQDDAGPWLRKEFPELFYIVSPTGHDYDSDYGSSTWTGISGETFYRFGGPDSSLVSNDWVRKHVHAHGPLGDRYPLTKYIMEGDSPSWMYLIPNGLGVPERPDFGSWGGRYGKKGGIWTNVTDTVVGVDGKTYTQNHATIWRWRRAYQNDFEARMDWQIKEPKDANHPPLVRVAGELTRTVKAGATVILDASGSSDPDGNALAWSWFVYKEAGSFAGSPQIDGGNTAVATVKIPTGITGSVHVILTAEDSGTPNLSRYARIILEVVRQKIVGNIRSWYRDPPFNTEADGPKPRGTIIDDGGNSLLKMLRGR